MASFGRRRESSLVCTKELSSLGKVRALDYRSEGFRSVGISQCNRNGNINVGIFLSNYSKERGKRNGR